MPMPAPTEHLEEALKLQADNTVDLWEMRLRGVDLIYRFWNGPTRTWQGNSYEGLACELTGDSRDSAGKSSRPTLQVQNPEKIFGAFAAEGYFDLAEMIRRRVLQQHFLDNVNIYQQHVWICARPSAVGSNIMQLELRSPMDQPAWKTPRRTYSPPDFPFVSFS